MIEEVGSRWDRRTPCASKGQCARSCCAQMPWQPRPMLDEEEDPSDEFLLHKYNDLQTSESSIKESWNMT